MLNLSESCHDWKSFNPVLKMMTSLGLQPSSPIQRWLNYGTKGSRGCSTLLKKQRIFISSLSQKKTYAAALKGNGKTATTISPAGGSGLVDGMEAGSSCPGGDDGKVDMDACWTCFLLFSSFLSPPGILFLFIRYNGLFAGKTNTLFSFLEGTNGE